MNVRGEIVRSRLYEVENRCEQSLYDFHQGFPLSIGAPTVLGFEPFIRLRGKRPATLTLKRLSENVSRRQQAMKARLIAFGEIEVEEERYDYDVVIDGGKVRKRKKGPSKQYREGNGHTPLSLKEEIPWSGRQLIVGTGTYGRLPIMAEVQQEAERRGVKLVAVPTEEACRMLRDLKPKNAYAILHTTC